MKLFNSNFAHNCINVLILALPALEVFDWTPFFSDKVALQIAGGLALLKIVINALRDGIPGMIKQQPPVQ